MIKPPNMRIGLWSESEMLNDGIKRFIEIHIPVGACNMRCQYCYIGNHKNNVSKLNYSIEEIKKAFSKKRLGGICLLSICSDGEPTLLDELPDVIEALLSEGHYVMLVTNGVSRTAIKRCLYLNSKYIDRLFFKLSFHYEEMKRLNLLDAFFENVREIETMGISYTVEYIVCDDTIDIIDEMKSVCLREMGALPQMNIPRDERKHNLGICSKHTLKNYYQMYQKLDVSSELFDYRFEKLGKKYTDYCYAGLRSLWVNLGNGKSYQCYKQPVLQDFMKDVDKKVKWLPVGNNCTEAHCFVVHAYSALGVVEPMNRWKINYTYTEIRNRSCKDKEDWIKGNYKKIFDQGIDKKKNGLIIRRMVNGINDYKRWVNRM